MGITFTDDELTYLRGQRLGRLATVDTVGAPQNNPVGYVLDDETGTILVAGTAMGRSRKYRNVRRNAGVSLVVDDLASTDPWRVRGVEVRGTAEALEDVDPPMAGLSRELIRITPRWIGNWGLVPEQEGLTSRGLQADARPQRGTADARAQQSAGTAVPQLVDAYFAGFDERRAERSWLESIFSDDITVRFPAGESQGLTALSDLSRKILGMWSATLHQTSNHQVLDTSDGVAFAAALSATHVHRPDEPGAHLRIGARVSGTASRRAPGWRIDHLAIDLVWSEGDGPRHVHHATPDV